MSDFYILHQNNWGELFEEKINSRDHPRDFIDAHRKNFTDVDVNYYIQRNSRYYEKTIERTKRNISKIIPDHTN